MIVYFSGPWKQGVAEGLPETLMKGEANLMMSYAEFHNGKPNGRFKAILAARRSRAKFLRSIDMIRKKGSK